MCLGGTSSCMRAPMDLPFLLQTKQRERRAGASGAAGDLLLQPCFPLCLAGGCVCRFWGSGAGGSRLDEHMRMIVTARSQCGMPAMGALLAGQVRIKSQSLLMLGHEAQIAHAEFLTTDTNESWVLLLWEV